VAGDVCGLCVVGRRRRWRNPRGGGRKRMNQLLLMKTWCARAGVVFVVSEKRDDKEDGFFFPRKDCGDGDVRT
jgi:hypothetical protein